MIAGGRAWLALVLLALACGCGAGAADRAGRAQRADITNLNDPGHPLDRQPSAVCPVTSQRLSIDGRGDERAWGDALTVASFAAWWEPGATVPNDRTRARILCAPDGIYFLAQMKDRTLRSFSERDDDRLWLGDVFELFFKPDGEAPAYYEFQVNPANARLDMVLPRRDVDAYDLWHAARDFEWRTAVRIVEDGWVAEGWIPWSDFAPSGGRPSPAATWRFALCRYDYGAIGATPELSCSARLTQPDFHRHGEWQELRFR